jgi:RTX calcium-binding nonapeptide repeat (4 copies)
MTRAARCSALAVVLALLPAAAADGHGIIRREGSVLRFTAPDPGVGAHVTISSPRAGTVDFHDTTSPGGMDWGPCFPRTERLSSCSTRGVKRIEVEVFDGDDVITVRAGAPVRVLGGEGNDRLTGGFGSDLLTGGSGADLLDGGQGRDTLDGAEGDDALNARDGAADQVGCGSGSDTLAADRGDTAVAECEGVSRGEPPADRRGPRLRLAAGRRQRMGRSRSLKAAVSMNEPGRITLAGRLLIAGRPAGTLRPARARPDAPDQRWTLRLRLPRGLAGAVRRALSGRRSVVAALSARSRDSAGNRGRTRRARVRIAR